MVINKMKEQVLQKKLSTVEMLVNPLTVFYIEIVFLVCCVNCRNITIPEEESEKSSPNKKIDFKCLSTYQNYQIMAYALLNMVRHVVSPTNSIMMIKEARSI